VNVPAAGTPISGLRSESRGETRTDPLREAEMREMRERLYRY